MLWEEDKELRDGSDNFDSCIMVESQDRLLTIVLVMNFGQKCRLCFLCLTINCGFCS
jgi:hypothetical protein